MGALPGAGYFFAASSRTRTQSSPSGVLKSFFPLLGYSPISELSPVRGFNHQHFTLDPEILLMSIVTVRAFGIYAMTVEPSAARVQGA